MNERIDAILSFWFGEAGEVVDVERWFKKDPAFDQELRARFGGDIDRAAKGELDAWAADPSGALALIVLLDQFSRNAFRATPRAFEQDARALKVSLDGQARGQDASLSFLERYMFYMPMIHTEDRDVQKQGVAKFGELVKEARTSGAAERVVNLLRSAHGYAEAHERIIARFGRFPHRNAIVGRTSTPEELSFLAEPNSGF